MLIGVACAVHLPTAETHVRVLGNCVVTGVDASEVPGSRLLSAGRAKNACKHASMQAGALDQPCKIYYDNIIISTPASSAGNVAGAESARIKQWQSLCAGRLKVSRLSVWQSDTVLGWGVDAVGLTQHP